MKRRALLVLTGGLLASSFFKPVSGKEKLISRKIPSTGEEIPGIGLGTWQVFDVAGDARELGQARETLRMFVEGGGRVVDSSPMYGSSETVTGQLAAELGVAPWVHFLGWRTDVAELYPQFDLFTLSSHSEGTSVSLLEAMSCGVCAVVTDVGGNADVLGPGLAHRLVPPADPAALAEAWLRGLGDPAARAADGPRGEARVAAQYGAEAMVRRYEALYSAGPGTAPRR